MTRETFAETVRRPAGAGQILRAAARHGVLSMLAAVQRSSTQRRFIRFLHAHYVFDDQRSAFERQIRALSRLGEFVTVDDALAMLRGDVPIDGRYFQISYDDGLACVGRNAVPILHEHGVPAIVFVNSAVAGDADPAERAAWLRATNYRRPPEVMDWETLAATGLEIGAHTRTHVRLAAISHDRPRLEAEIAGCKADIEAAIGRPCRFFAWPYGTPSDVDATALAAIREAGFTAAFGAFRMAAEPRKTDLFMIPRHHFEPHWPEAHLRFFALGGLEKGGRETRFQQ